MTFRTRLLQPLAKAVLYLSGWKLIGQNYKVPKSVIVAYPHIRATDLYYTILIGLALDLHLKIVAKEELFVYGLGWLLKALGLVPIKRGGKSNTTTLLADMFGKKSENFHLVMAPTGTRREGAEWKTGFLSVARKAQVPILLAVVNRKEKTCGIFSGLYTTASQEVDLADIMRRYNLQK